MDPLIWIAIAFALGLVARQIGLPPLVGFLAAGFVLNAHGVEETEGLRTISNIGIWGSCCSGSGSNSDCAA